LYVEIKLKLKRLISLKFAGQNCRILVVSFTAYTRVKWLSKFSILHSVPFSSDLKRVLKTQWKLVNSVGIWLQILGQVST